MLEAPRCASWDCTLWNCQGDFIPPASARSQREQDTPTPKTKAHSLVLAPKPRETCPTKGPCARAKCPHSWSMPVAGVQGTWWKYLRNEQTGGVGAGRGGGSQQPGPAAGNTESTASSAGRKVPHHTPFWSRPCCVPLSPDFEKTEARGSSSFLS